MCEGFCYSVPEYKSGFGHVLTDVSKILRLKGKFHGIPILDSAVDGESFLVVGKSDYGFKFPPVGPVPKVLSSQPVFHKILWGLYTKVPDGNIATWDSNSSRLFQFYKHFCNPFLQQFKVLVGFLIADCLAFWPLAGVKFSETV